MNVRISSLTLGDTPKAVSITAEILRLALGATPNMHAV